MGQRNENNSATRVKNNMTTLLETSNQSITGFLINRYVSVSGIEVYNYPIISRVIKILLKITLSKVPNDPLGVILCNCHVI